MYIHISSNWAKVVSWPTTISLPRNLATLYNNKSLMLPVIWCCVTTLDGQTHNHEDVYGTELFDALKSMKGKGKRQAIKRSGYSFCLCKCLVVGSVVSL